MNNTDDASATSQLLIQYGYRRKPDMAKTQGTRLRKFSQVLGKRDTPEQFAQKVVDRQELGESVSIRSHNKAR